MNKENISPRSSKQPSHSGVIKHNCQNVSSIDLNKKLNKLRERKLSITNGDQKETNFELKQEKSSVLHEKKCEALKLLKKLASSSVKKTTESIDGDAKLCNRNKPLVPERKIPNGVSQRVGTPIADRRTKAIIFDKKTTKTEAISKSTLNEFNQISVPTVDHSPKTSSNPVQDPDNKSKVDTKTNQTNVETIAAELMTIPNETPIEESIENKAPSTKQKPTNWSSFESIFVAAQNEDIATLLPDRIFNMIEFVLDNDDAFEQLIDQVMCIKWKAQKGFRPSRLSRSLNDISTSRTIEASRIPVPIDSRSPSIRRRQTIGSYLNTTFIQN